MSSENTMEIAISATGLGKCYLMYEKPVHRLLQGVLRTRKYSKEFWALREVDLCIRKGETFGIIGRNGSGKSTLLQLIAGTLTPTEGEVTVNGKVAALLELGSGFNPDFTGRENIYLNAAILGLSRDQVDGRLESILEFADIGEFIDQPVRSYSSGMAVRLAFSVIAHVDADILIVDEALSVGDTFFAQKCMRFLREFQQRGTLLFVSHDSGAVTNLCDRAIWLNGGRLQLEGDSKTVVETYLAHQHAKARSVARGDEVAVVDRNRSLARDVGEGDFREAKFKQLGVQTRFEVFEFDNDAVGVEFGTGEATIRNVAMVDGRGAPVHLLAGGEDVCLQIEVEVAKSIDDVIIGFYLKDRLGQRLFGDNTHIAMLDTPIAANAGEVLRADFKFRMPIMPAGSYLFDVAVASGTQEDHTQHHWIHDALEIKATDTTMRNGLLGVPMREISVSQRVVR